MTQLVDLVAANRLYPIRLRNHADIVGRARKEADTHPANVIFEVEPKMNARLGVFGARARLIDVLDVNFFQASDGGLRTRIQKSRKSEAAVFIRASR